MLGLYGEYDVVVAGAGITGFAAAVAAREEGARTLVVERSGFIGGLVTAGRMTKPTGPVDSGIFWDLLQRAAAMGGASTSTHAVYWGDFTGIFDPEVMRRVMIETLEQAGVELLLYSPIVDVLADDSVRGIEVAAKSGRKLVLCRATVDATGDGDVAAFAGARFEIGRPRDGKTQPITSYFRVINVDTPRVVQYIIEHPEEIRDIVMPPNGGCIPEDCCFNLMATGFHGLVRKAREAGDWKLNRSYITFKAGMLPGEVNLNITRYQGVGLDERTLTEAEIDIHKQAYHALDFLRKYLPGFERATMLDIGPMLGVRETRRITGDYILTYEDLKAERRFQDSVCLCRSGIDIHEPGGEGGYGEKVGSGFGIPYRCLLPAGVEGLLVAGRCISVDHMVHGSTRNVPACALTGEAAGTAAAMAASQRIPPRQLPVLDLQSRLSERGIQLGN